MKLIATGVVHSITGITVFLSSCMSFKSVTNTTEPDNQIQTNIHVKPTCAAELGKPTCPMELGKPFVTNYMDQQMDMLRDDDWNEFKIF